jgi:hypothetical protein
MDLLAAYDSDDEDAQPPVQEEEKPQPMEPSSLKRKLNEDTTPKQTKDSDEINETTIEERQQKQPKKEVQTILSTDKRGGTTQSSNEKGQERKGKGMKLPRPVLDDDDTLSTPSFAPPSYSSTFSASYPITKKTKQQGDKNTEKKNDNEKEKETQEEEKEAESSTKKKGGSTSPSVTDLSWQLLPPQLRRRGRPNISTEENVVYDEAKYKTKRNNPSADSANPATSPSKNNVVTKD